MAKYTAYTIETDRAQTCVIEFGAGEKTLVVLPGMSLHAILPSASSIAKRYRCFTEDYRVLVVDRAQGDMAGATVLSMAQDTAATLDKMGIKGASVFGASQGGMMALVLAATRPDLVERVAVGSSMGWVSDTCRDMMDDWARLAEAGDVVSLNRNIFSHVYSEAFQTKFANALRVLESQGTPEELARYANLARASMGFDDKELLRGIACPVLVVGAEDDRVIGPEASVALAQMLDCKLVMLEGAPHAAYDETPGYTELLKEFFD